MKILVAPDSFKGAATGLQVANAMTKGLLDGNSELKIVTLPLADGGEGTLEILHSHLNGSIQNLRVSDPLGRTIDAWYLIIGNKAMIELAEASGLPALSIEERDPTRTNTLGTGEIIADALGKGCDEIVLAIGGSATNDAGTGIAEALGFRFFDRQNNPVRPNGGNLVHIHKIIAPGPEKTGLKKMKVLCDVTNPFSGPDGAVNTYGPQKGADSGQLELLEAGMIHFKDLILKWRGIDLDTIPGSGAAGGVGGGMIAFFDAQLVSGIDYLMEELNMIEKIQACDLVLTGEGSLDFQTLHGKTIGGLLKVAKAYQKPVVAFAGNVLLSAHEIREAGLTAAFSIQPGVQELSKAMSSTLQNLKDVASNFARILSI